MEGTPVARLKRLPAQYHPEKDIKGKVQDMLSAEPDVRDEIMAVLGEEYLAAAERGDETDLHDFIEEGFPVTWQDPENGLTALHIAAGCQARKALRVLLATDQCDFLLRDNHGRLASEMAYLYGEDVAVARLLRNRERKQAEAQGIKLTRRERSG